MIETLLRDVPLSQIDIEGNLREDIRDLDDLAASIREHGVMQPVRVTPSGDRFRLIYGQRRVLASRLAGLETIPATIADAQDAQRELAAAIVENIQREDLNPIEEAKGIERMIGLGLMQGEISRMLGRSETYVSNRLRVVRADPVIVDAVATGRLSVATANIVAGLPSRQQATLARRVIRENWTRQRTESFLAPRRSKVSPVVKAADVAPDQHAARYADVLVDRARNVDELLAVLLLWALVEMDAMIQGRFLKRHPTGRLGHDVAWAAISELPPPVVAGELAHVLGETIAEYGSVSVKVAVPGGRPVEAPLAKPVANCVVCGTPLEGRRIIAKYCSQSCRTKAFTARTATVDALLDRP